MNKKIPKEEKKEVPEVASVVPQQTQEKHRHQLMLILSLIGLLFGIMLVAYLVYTSITTFTYQGTTYTKIRYGELLLYHVVFPLKNSITGEHIADFNFYLRNDPRTIQNIPFPEDFKLTRSLVLTGDADKVFCEDNGIAFGNLANFFKNNWQIPLLANSSLHCGENPESTYLVMKLANETRIDKLADSCYTLSVSNCAVLNVTERFIIGTLARQNGY